jgi:hypothetical protein
MTIAIVFAHGVRLWLLVAVAGLLVAYVVLQVAKRGYAVRFTNLDLLDKVAPRGRAGDATPSPPRSSPASRCRSWPSPTRNAPSGSRRSGPRSWSPWTCRCR